MSLQKTSPIIIILLIGVLTPSCNLHWSKAMQRGSVAQEQFTESVPIELSIGLIIVPVEINGQSYRFLFDTGAPFSISEKLQQQLQFKRVSKGHIRDSENNRKAVDFVSVDEVKIGEIAFNDLTAFVGDFDSNPALSCMKLDGIIGGNLMRHCNWLIDYHDKVLGLSDRSADHPFEESVVVPFRTNAQFNIFVDLVFQGDTITNMTLDSGSNGSISLPEDIFQLLETKGVIKETFAKNGFSQSGFIGKVSELNSKIAFVDGIQSGGLLLDDTEVESSNKALIGYKILSRYYVYIDWDERQVYFSETDTPLAGTETYGISVGDTNNGGLYVQSVIEHSSADKEGIKPGMEIYELDGHRVPDEFGLCEYMNYRAKMGEQVRLRLGDGVDTLSVSMKKEKLVRRD